MNSVPRDLEPLLSGNHSPQRAFSYPGDRWRAWVEQLDGISPVLDSLPTELDRSTTARIVEGLLTRRVVPGPRGAARVPLRTGAGASGCS